MNPVALYLAMTPIMGLAADVTLSFTDMSQALIRPAYRVNDEVTIQTGRSNGTALDLSTSPNGTLTFDWRHSDLRLSYGPSFTWRDALGPSEDRDLLLMHAALVSFSHSPEGARWRLTLTQTGSIGTRNFSALTPLAPADPNVRPDPTVSRINLIPSVRTQSVKVASEQTGANLTYQWSRRLIANVGVAYGISGGYDGYEAILPRQTTESGSAGVTVATDREDTFATMLSGSHTLVTSGYEYWFAQGAETWTHKLSRDLSLSVSGGLVHVWTRCRPGSVCQQQDTRYADGTYQTRLLPLASASVLGSIYLLKRRDLVVTLVLGTAVSPVINPLSGELQTRLQGSSTLQAVVARRTTFAATLDGGQTIPINDPNAARVVGLGLLASHVLGRVVGVSGGYRSVWQFSNNSSFDLPRQWIAFLGLTITPPPIRL